MTDIKEHRAWVRAVTKLSIATCLMDDVVFLGIDPNIQAECREIWNRMDEIEFEMVRRIEQMEVGSPERVISELGPRPEELSGMDGVDDNTYSIYDSKGYFIGLTSRKWFEEKMNEGVQKYGLKLENGRVKYL